MRKLTRVIVVAAVSLGCGEANDSPGASAAGSSGAGEASAGSSSGGSAAAGSGNGGSSSAGAAGSSSQAGSGFGQPVTSTVSTQPQKLNKWVFAERVGQGVPFRSEVGARFEDGPIEFAGCTRKDIGPCYWIECPSPSAPEAFLQPSTGLLTYTAKDGVSALTFDSREYLGAFDGTLWNASGDAVTATIEGGTDIPAFTGSVTAPSNLTLVSPAITIGMPLTLPTSQDIPLAWSGGANGTAIFTLRGAPSPTPALNCEYPAGDGQGVVPALALSALSREGTYFLYFYSRNRVEQQAGAWTVRLTAVHYPDLQYALSQMVTLQ